MRRMAVVLALAAVLAGACGGGGGGDEEAGRSVTTDQERTTTTEADDATTTTAASANLESDCPLTPEMAEQVLGGEFKEEVGSGATEDGRFNCMMSSADRSLAASAMTFPVDDASYESAKESRSGRDVEGLGEEAFIGGDTLHVRISQDVMVLFTLPGFDDESQLEAKLRELAELVLPKIDID